MKRPDFHAIFSRAGVLINQFHEWAKASRKRAWTVYALSILAAMACEDLAIAIGIQDAAHVLFAAPAIFVAYEAYHALAEGLSKSWRRALIVLASFFLILGPTPSDLVRELEIAVLGVAVIAGMCLAVWLIWPTKRPTLKRKSASHFTKEGKPKVAYASQDEARGVANMMQARDGAAMNTYVCGECRSWHIGHAK